MGTGLASLKFSYQDVGLSSFSGKQYQHQSESKPELARDAAEFTCIIGYSAAILIPKKKSSWFQDLETNSKQFI